MVTSQKKKVTNPGIRQRVLDALTGEPQTFAYLLTFGFERDALKREIGVLCANGLAVRGHSTKGCDHYTAAPHVLEARRLAGRDQRVAGLLRDAERAKSLWFDDEAISDLAAWAGTPQYFMLTDASAARRQRIAAWYVLRRALGDAGYRYLALSLATNPEIGEERPPELWVRILRVAQIPVWMDQPAEPGVWFTGEGRTVPDTDPEPAKLQWVSGAQAKDAKWGPETATLLNRACALLRAAGYNVEAPVPAKPGAFHPAKPGAFHPAKPASDIKSPRALLERAGVPLWSSTARTPGIISDGWKPPIRMWVADKDGAGLLPEYAEIIASAITTLEAAGYEIDAMTKKEARHIASLQRTAEIDKVLAEEDMAPSRGISRDPDVMGGAAVIAGTRITTESIAVFHDAGYTTAQIIGQYPTLSAGDIRAAIAHEKGLLLEDAEPSEWKIGDRVRHGLEHVTGEIVDQKPFDVFKIAFDDRGIPSRWVTKKALDAYYTREPRDAQPPAKIDDDCQAGGRGMSLDEVRGRYGHPKTIDGEPVRVTRVIQAGPCDPTPTQTSAPSPRQDGKLSPPAGAAYYELLTSGPFGLDRDSEIKERLERAGFKDLDLSAVFEELHAYAGVVYSKHNPPGASTRRSMLPLLAQPSV